MWAEANNYWYRGECVAKLNGGNIYTIPEIVLLEDAQGNTLDANSGICLQPIDVELMLKKNHEVLHILEQTTVKKILTTYEKYKKKVELFHVAYSGGKDSAVLFDLVKKALPKNSFVLVFGDTGMEFPDTYNYIEQVKKECDEENIPFYTAKSHLNPKDSWELFAPPSRTLRWCCSVHKSTPQTLKLQEITGKTNYTGLAFVGVRAHESAMRATYEYENFGKKQKGQYSHNSILEWTSAEIWLYIFANNILINKAYKRGSARVGCLCCPMGGGKASYIEHQNYTNESNKFIKHILESNGRSTINDKDYLTNGGWNARRNGQFLPDIKQNYTEMTYDNMVHIDVTNPKTDWQEWIKTLGFLHKKNEKYIVFFQNQYYEFNFQEKENGYTIKFPAYHVKTSPLFTKSIRYVFRRAAYCVMCKTCQILCQHNSISFSGKVKIENCKHCLDCHAVEAGCLVYHSINLPIDGGSKMQAKSINTLSNHAPKTEWLQDFFARQAEFFVDNSLGKNQNDCFRRFLRDAQLLERTKVSILPLATLIKEKDWTSPSMLAIMYINLANNNLQFRWYIKEMIFEKEYTRDQLKEKLLLLEQKKDTISSILNAFKRISETPFGKTLHCAFTTDDDALFRTKCIIEDHTVILYGLFKFAEKCGDYKEFTLTSLMDTEIERDGVSPSEIFGLTREEMEPILLGLSARYSEFITVSFTHDLEKISLAQDKTSEDVLLLF